MLAVSLPSCFYQCPPLSSSKVIVNAPCSLALQEGGLLVKCKEGIEFYRSWGKTGIRNMESKKARAWAQRRLHSLILRNS